MGMGNKIKLDALYTPLLDKILLITFMPKYIPLKKKKYIFFSHKTRIARRSALLVIVLMLFHTIALKVKESFAKTEKIPEGWGYTIH